MTVVEKELLEVTQMLENRYLEYQKRGTLLDAETLEYITPYKGRLFLKGNLDRVVEKSKINLTKRRRRKMVIVGISITTLFLVISLTC